MSMSLKGFSSTVHVTKFRYAAHSDWENERRGPPGAANISL